MTQQQVYEAILANKNFKSLQTTYLREIISIAYNAGSGVKMIQIKQDVPEDMWYGKRSNRIYFAIKTRNVWRPICDPARYILDEHIKVKNHVVNSKKMFTETEKSLFG